MLYEDFLAAESYIEPAAVALLAQRGFKVASPFVPVIGQAPNGDPITAPRADDACSVVFNFTKLDSTTRIFITRGGVKMSWAGAIEGVLEISHGVPVALPDEVVPEQPGDIPGCYPRLLAQRGRIRAIFAEDLNPFRDQLPAIDRVSIEISEPDRGVDRDRSANTATERFRMRLIAAAGLIE